MYAPPYKITSKMVELISQISEKIGETNALQDPHYMRLRRENRIRTIHSSLAIENNTLSLEQMTAVIEGRRVVGSPREIQEVKNALEAYELLPELDPCEERDLLKAHALMMRGLVERSGRYRSGGVGIFNGEIVVHVAPPAERVPALMADLFDWLKRSGDHPLIKSCVFHYEFEFIHPFQDGNGRMGRLWQSAILAGWKELFAWLPVETLIKDDQAGYYRALGTSDKEAESTAFVEFMLDLILRALRVSVKVSAKVSVNQQKIIDAIRRDNFVTIDALAQIVGIAKKNISSNLKKLQVRGLIKRVGADRNGHWEAL